MRIGRIIIAAVFFTVSVLAFCGVPELAALMRYHLGPTLATLLGYETFFFPFYLLADNVTIAPPTALFSAVAFKALVVFAVFAIIAAFFGRIYCGAVCPLGILQDILGRLTSFHNPFKHGQPTANYRKTRGIILAITTILLLGGFALLFRLLDPFSLFGAVAAALFNPPLVHLYLQLVPDAGLHQLPLTAALLAPGIITFLIFLGLVVWKRRIFCTTICPIGAILGCFVQDRVWLGLRLQLNEHCVGCRQCARQCPAGCIDVGAKTLDNARCLRCMNCVSACKFKAITWSPASIAQKKNAAAPETDADLAAKSLPALSIFSSRRKIIASTAVFFSGLGLRYLSIKYRQVDGAVRDTAAQKWDDLTALPWRLTGKTGAAIFPPGAGSAQRFAAKCTSCHLCLSQCTGNVLRPAGGDYAAVHLEFSKGMCEFNCNNCGQVCPTGAIVPLALADKRRQRIGMAYFDPEICVAVVDRTDCGACAEHCPTHAVSMVEVDGMRVPYLQPKYCIGCGACQYACPVRHGPKQVQAIVVNPIAIQVVAEVEPEKPPEAPPSADDEWLL